ncbi:DUF3179 domain-containing protein [Nodosilinea sp. LEGE 07298]|nr:DUF3179 domain-containing protein [Nodosilinea sp. LEGE 07298]
MFCSITLTRFRQTCGRPSAPPQRGSTTFGVSGKLYQSRLVMCDRADDSRWVLRWRVGSNY